MSLLPEFHCRQCGTCCRWPGSVLLTNTDIAAAADALHLSETDFIDMYTHLARNRTGLTLREASDGACILLNESGRCAIYEARPRQCRDFPHNWQVDGCPALMNYSVASGKS